MRIEDVYPILIERIVDMNLLPGGQPLLFSTSRNAWYDFVINPVFEKPSKEEIIDELDMYEAEAEAQKLLDEMSKAKREELKGRLKSLDLNRVGPLVGKSFTNYGLLKRLILKTADEVLVARMEEKQLELDSLYEQQTLEDILVNNGLKALLRNIERICEDESSTIFLAIDKPKILKYVKRKISEL